MTTTNDDTIKKEHYSNYVSTAMTAAALDWMEQMVNEVNADLPPWTPRCVFRNEIIKRIKEERG